MSLYLSEWDNGYEIFRDFAELAWSPSIECVPDDFDGTKIKAAVYFMSIDAVESLADNLDDNLHDEFIKRFNLATAVILEKLDVKKFIHLNFNYAMKLSSDYDRANTAVNVAFQQFIMEYEFWNKVTVTQLYTNFIFYGMLTDPAPAFFAIPPMNDWDIKYKYGCAGYPHPINFFD